jgi:hypothetical protein
MHADTRDNDAITQRRLRRALLLCHPLAPSEPSKNKGPLLLHSCRRTPIPISAFPALSRIVLSISILQCEDTSGAGVQQITLSNRL